MDEPQIRLLTDADAEVDGPAAGFARKTVELPVRDDVLAVACDVPDRPMRLADIVPFVRSVDDRLMAIYLRQAKQEKLRVFCRKGCDACCHRYLIVYSPAEMYYQMEFIDSLDEPRRSSILEWLSATAERARSSGLIERLTTAAQPDDKPLKIIEKWWLSQDDGTCPFLDTNSGACAIHTERFIACREHFSHSPPECCANLEINRMATPLTLINSLWQLEQALTGEPGGVLSVPMMKLWSDARAEQAQRTFGAVGMIETLFGIWQAAAENARRLRGTATVDRGQDGDSLPSEP